MKRTLIGLVLGPWPCLLALVVVFAAWGLVGGATEADDPPPSGADASPFFAFRESPDITEVSPPILELAWHADVPGCPGCPATFEVCVVTLRRLGRP